MISRHLGTEAQGSFANTGPNEVVFIAVGAPESNSVFDAVVIGAGQAGLSTSYHLSRLGVAQLGVFRRKEAQRSVRQRFSNAAAFEDDMVHAAAGDGPPGAPDSFAPVAEVIELSAGKRQTLSSRAKRERDAAPA